MYCNITEGVPQGWILGANFILFIYIIDLYKNVNNGQLMLNYKNEKTQPQTDISVSEKIIFSKSANCDDSAV